MRLLGRGLGLVRLRQRELQLPKGCRTCPVFELDRHRGAPSMAKQSRVRSASPTSALAENAKTV